MLEEGKQGESLRGFLCGKSVESGQLELQTFIPLQASRYRARFPDDVVCFGFTSSTFDTCKSKLVERLRKCTGNEQTT
jgi:hypothetical protein